MAGVEPSPGSGFTPPPYEWTGQAIDGDILAAVAFFFFPVLTFYGSRQFVTSVTSASCLILAYTAYILLGYYAHLSPVMEYILVGAAAGAAFVVVLAAIDLGKFLLGAAAGALMANLILHFVRIPLDLIEHEFIFRLLFLLVPAVVLGLLTVYLTHFLIRPVAAFVGSYLLSASLSRFLFRMQLATSAPLDPPTFFGPLDLTTPNPTPAFTTSLLLSYALVVLWLVLTLVGIVMQYHNEWQYTEIESINVDGKVYRRAPFDEDAQRYGLRATTTQQPRAYHGTAGRNVIQDL